MQRSDMINDRPAQLGEADDELRRGKSIGIGHCDPRDDLADVRRKCGDLIRAQSMWWHGGRNRPSPRDTRSIECAMQQVRSIHRDAIVGVGDHDPAHGSLARRHQLHHCPTHHIVGSVREGCTTDFYRTNNGMNSGDLAGTPPWLRLRPTCWQSALTTPRADPSAAQSPYLLAFLGRTIAQPIDTTGLWMTRV